MEFSKHTYLFTDQTTEGERVKAVKELGGWKTYNKLIKEMVDKESKRYWHHDEISQTW